MIRCKVIEDFSLSDFDKLKNIKRSRIDVYGKLYIGDTFECDEGMVIYLMGNNIKGKKLVKIIELKSKK